MRKIALHYPDISPAWETLVPTALFYSKIALMRPYDPELREDPEVTRLRYELDLIVDVDPRAAAKAIGHKFAEAIQRFDTTDYRDTGPAGNLISIHSAKVSTEAKEALTTLGLAERQQNPLTPWLLVDRRVARVYLCVLAEELARQNNLQAITNHERDFKYVCDWTTDAIAEALMGPAHSPHPLDTTPSALYNTIGLLAVSAFLPHSASEVTPQQVVEIRKRYQADFLAFVDEVETAAADLSTALGDIADESVLEAYLKSEVENRFVQRAEDLGKALRGLKIATAPATITAKFEVPALLSVTAAGVVAHQPVVAGSSAIAAGLFGVYARMREQRNEILKPSGATFLYDLQHALAPPSHLARVAQTIRRIGIGQQSSS